MTLEHQVTIKAAVWRSGRLLLLRERDDEGRTWLDLPGGRLEAGEELLEALRRELGEELGVEAASIGRLPLHVWNGVSPAGNSVVGLVYAVELRSIDFDHGAAPEVLRALWCEAADLADEREHVHMATIRTLLEQRLGESPRR